MDCQAVYNLMNRYLDGEITPEEEKVLEFHLGRCKNCLKEFGELKKMQILLDTMEPSNDFTDKVMMRIAIEKQSKYKHLLPKISTSWAVAIFICLIFSALIWFTRPGTEVIISKGQVQASVTENGEQGFKVVDGEIRIKGLQGTLTAINSQIFLEKPTAKLQTSIYDQTKTKIVRFFRYLKNLFTNS